MVFRRSSYGKIIASIMCYFIVSISYSQKKYDYKISFSGSEFDRSNLKVSFSQGYQTISIPPGKDDKIIGSNSSFLKYPILEIIYFSPKHKPTFYRFFIKKQISEVELYYDTIRDDIIVKRESGLLSFENAGQKKFNEFGEDELTRLHEFEGRYNNDFSNVESSVLKQFDSYYEAVKDKSFQFIKRHPKKLFSIWLFMNNILGDPKYSKEELKSVYSTYFKEEYKNTFEENYILNSLSESRLAVNTEAPYRDLDFKDLSGKIYTINSFKGKPLLITIWATWCVPCVAEIPTLKRLYSKYRASLEILSFSTDADEGKLRRFISAQNIEWKNVFDRSDICRIYNSDNGIPQVYLLDNNGVIIYSRAKSNDYDLHELEKVIDKLNRN